MKNLLNLIFVLTISLSCTNNEGSSVGEAPAVLDNKSFESWFQHAQTSEIENDPLKVNFYVVLDGSGSMDDSSCAEGSTRQLVARKALEEFSKSLPPEYNLGLLAFDSEGITERMPLGSSNRSAFVQAVNSVQANSGTPLRTAIERAFEKLAQQAKKQQGYGEYHLIVVTDGDAGLSEDPEKIVRKIAHESPVVLHTLGFCIGEDHVLNSKFVNFKPANNPSELVKGLSDVITESLSFNQTL